MKCKLHLYDQSSTVGVCASCLRYRLLSLHNHSLPVSDDSHQHVNPLFFPRSVSPNLSRDYTNDSAASTSCKQKKSALSLLSDLFRSRSEKLDPNRKLNLNQNQSGSTQIDTSSFSSSSSSTWFSMFSSGRRKGSDGDFNGRKPCRRFDRGMSPVRGENYDCDQSPSGNCSPKRKNTPVEPSAMARRRRSKSVSGLTFCLSPLVRASPNLPSDGGHAGGFWVSKKKTPSTEVAFCKNRSRKLVDFGRGNGKR